MRHSFGKAKSSIMPIHRARITHSSRIDLLSYCTLPNRIAFNRREVAAFLRTAGFFFVTCRGYQDVNILDASHIALMTYIGPHANDVDPLDPIDLTVG